MRPTPRAVASCAALGLTSLAISCAPVANQPAAAPILAALTQEPARRIAAPLLAGDRPGSGVLEARRSWVHPSGARQVGEASYYGPEFAGRRMADGRRFDPRSASVAHRTLPFGTTVLVRNLGNGRSTTATVEDRGPFVHGRIIDLSPQLAERLGMMAEGIASVEVTPVEVAEAVDQRGRGPLIGAGVLR